MTPILHAVSRIVGWWYIPDLVFWILLVLPRPHSCKTREGKTRESTIYGTVIFIFLAYVQAQAYQGLPSTFYDILQVPLDSSQQQLHKANRTFARKYHPDKGGEGEVFIQGRLAYLVLKDPVTRFAYDRCDTH